MDHTQIRKGITQAKFNESFSNVLAIEFAIISLIIGLKMHSWLWGGATFIALNVAILFKPFAIILIILLSSIWAFIGYIIGSLIGSDDAIIFSSILGFIMGLGAHLASLEWIKDVSS